MLEFVVFEVVCCLLCGMIVLHVFACFCCVRVLVVPCFFWLLFGGMLKVRVTLTLSSCSYFFRVGGWYVHYSRSGLRLAVKGIGPDFSKKACKQCSFPHFISAAESESTF